VGDAEVLLPAVQARREQGPHLGGMEGVGKSSLEALMLAQLRAAKCPPDVTEHRFDPSRRWRFDMAWTEHMLALEIQGGSWVAGAHGRGKQFQSDCEKFNAAVLAGWRVLKVTTDHVHSGYALDTVREALRCKSSDSDSP